MKTLKEIKDEYAKENGMPDWIEFKWDMDQYETLHHMDIVAERYATEKARESVIASLEKAAESATTEIVDFGSHYMKKSSITSEENIIIK